MITETSQRLKNYLLPLGSTKNEIASTLKSLGFAGDKIPGTNNAIAKYLQTKEMDWYQLWCGKGMINTGNGTYFFYRSELDLKALHEFAADLFSGQCPELEN